jgi:hypothetical protein
LSKKKQAEAAVAVADAARFLSGAVENTGNPQMIEWSIVAAGKAARNAVAYCVEPKTQIRHEHGLVIKWKQLPSSPYKSARGHYVEWDNAMDQEALWQIRRFLDVKSALSSGKKWPSLGVTK